MHPFLAGRKAHETQVRAERAAALQAENEGDSSDPAAGAGDDARIPSQDGAPLCNDESDDDVSSDGGDSVDLRLDGSGDDLSDGDAAGVDDEDSSPEARHKRRMQLADELMGSTGLSQAEVLELLDDFDRKKDDQRQQRAQTTKQQKLTKKVKRGKNAQPTEAEDAQPQQKKVVWRTSEARDIAFVTEVAQRSPRVQDERESLKQNVPKANRPNIIAPKVIKHPPTSVPTTSQVPSSERQPGDSSTGGVKSTLSMSKAERLDRQLAELFPNGVGAPAAKGNSQHADHEEGDDDQGHGMTLLSKRREERRRRQAEEVRQFLAARRGEVDRPDSLKRDNRFAQKYEQEREQREELRRAKEAAAAEQREKEEHERRMRGFFSNQAIRKRMSKTAESEANRKAKEAEDLERYKQKAKQKKPPPSDADVDDDMLIHCTH